MTGMEPFRVISSQDDLVWLPLDSIVCPPGMPGLAYRKTWRDLFVTFESPNDWTVREIWTILTMHCPADRQEAWVLWDAGAKKAALPKHGAFVSVVPSRSPRRKAHTAIGYAKSSITGRLYGSGATEDMSILQLDPATSQYVEIHNIPKGTLKSQLPW